MTFRTCYCPDATDIRVQHGSCESHGVLQRSGGKGDVAERRLATGVEETYFVRALGFLADLLFHRYLCILHWTGCRVNCPRRSRTYNSAKLIVHRYPPFSGSSSSQNLASVPYDRNVLTC